MKVNWKTLLHYIDLIVPLVGICSLITLAFFVLFTSVFFWLDFMISHVGDPIFTKTLELITLMLEKINLVTNLLFISIFYYIVKRVIEKLKQEKKK